MILENQNSEFKILESQNPEFKIFQSQDHEFQNLELRILASKIMKSGYKILKAKILNSKSLNLGFWKSLYF